MTNRIVADAIAADLAVDDANAAAIERESRTRNKCHEMRNLVNTAVVAFDVLRSGSAGVGGSTGALLNRTLMELQELIAQSTEDVR